ncbi:17.8 kDa class I heat shock protein-like [Musa acuminata AAA Group]|uniref:17.8 kDa class I heat shock protein-like n=1 Tax=Musa acuminata AAA Group TaxID=214697 RepID=UPI0031D590A0
MRRKSSKDVFSGYLGHRGTLFDPFSTDILDWDPFARLVLGRRPARTNVEWRETANAHIITADLPGVRRREEGEVEDGSVLRINGEMTEEVEQGDTWHRWSGGGGASAGDFGCRRTPTWR